MEAKRRCDASARLVTAATAWSIFFLPISIGVLVNLVSALQRCIVSEQVIFFFARVG